MQEKNEDLDKKYRLVIDAFKVAVRKESLEECPRCHVLTCNFVGDVCAWCSGELAYEATLIPEAKADTVNHPSHYCFGRFEVIDVLSEWFPTDPLLWQVGKYIARASRKGNELEDLKKAKFYLERRIALMEGEKK